MFKRVLKPLKKRSFFLFGARGTGKSTFLENYFDPKTSLYINLLNPDLEEKYIRDPREFERDVQDQRRKIEWVLVDEIHKVPKILNLVHKMIEKNKMIKSQLNALERY